MIEKHIISLCCKNDRRGHKALYEACIPYVYSTVKRYIYKEEDRKDVVQEVFARVFENIKSYDENKGIFNTWLRKVAVNECLMFLRKTKKMSMLVPVEINDDITVGEDHGLENITRQDVENILRKMPEGYRVIFMLNVLDGYNHSEIAEKLGIQKETSRSQLTRAKKWIIKNIMNQKTKNAYGLF